MKNKKQSQKIIASILAIIMVIALVLGLAAPFFAAETNNSITIDAQIGFNQKYKIGAKTPFSVFLKNGGSNFKGELQVKIFIDALSDTNLYSIYSQEVDLPQGSAKKLNFDLVIPNYHDKIEISLVDNRKTVISKEIEVDYYEYSKTLVGVLTDDEEGMNVLKNLKVKDINTSDYRVYQNNEDAMHSLDNALIFIDENLFPKNEYILDNFNMIIINNYDTTLLNTEQLNALKKWINRGGKLVIGTGQNKDKVLKGLEGIIDFNNIDSNLDINLLDTEHSTAIIDIQKGRVLVHDFDLALGSKVTNLAIDTLSDLYDRFLLNEYKDDLYITNNFLNSIIIDDSNILIKVILLILAIYIIIVSPIMYLYLKRKDKLDKAWITMPIVAFVISIFIFGLSLFTSYSNVNINNLSFINFRNNTNIADVNTSLGVIAPKNIANLKINKNVDLTYANNMYVGRPNPNSKESIIYKISHDDDLNTNIKISKTLFRNANIIKSSDTKEFDGNIDISVYFEDSEIKCNISNNAGYNLEDCILSIGGIYTYLEKLDNAQAQEIIIKADDELIVDFDNDSMLENIFGSRYDFKDMKQKLNDKLLTRKQIKKNMRRQDMLSSIFRNLLNMGYINNDVNKIRFFAFNNDNINNLAATNNNKQVDMFNENIFFIEKDIILTKLSDGEKFDIPRGVIKVSNIYTDDTNNISRYISGDRIYIDSNTTVNFDFKLPDDINLEEFGIYWEALSYINPLQIYNVSKDLWEDIDKIEEISKENGELYNVYNSQFTTSLKDYIKQNNIITVRLESEWNMSIKLPNISIKGSK